MEGSSEPWTVAAQTTGRLIGDTVTDVVIQFRAVGVPIAQNQLDLVRRQVERSEQAVLVAGPDGRVLLGSQGLLDLLPLRTPPLENLSDLPQLFANPNKVARRLRDLMGRRQTWRGEAELRGPSEIRPVLVRGDPVLSTPDRVLGFVVVVIDMVERKAADTAVGASGRPWLRADKQSRSVSSQKTTYATSTYSRPSSTTRSWRPARSPMASR